MPSPILHAHNLEILVHSTPLNDRLLQAHTLSVPALDIQNSFKGHTSKVTYPVHKTLLFAERLSDQAFVEGDSIDRHHMVRQLVDGAWHNLDTKATAAEYTRPVNLILGEEAITLFRRDLGEAIRFEQGWFDSGMSSVVSWMVAGTLPSQQGVKESVRHLTHSMLETVSQRLLQSEKSRRADLAGQSLSFAARSDLDRSLSGWAEHAHTELRDRLDTALDGKNWGRTRWWKLLWRVDEVEYQAKEVLEQAWLVNAEKELIWISGRISEAGLSSPPQPVKSGATVEQGSPKPWARDIDLARSALFRNTMPPLQSLAQSLLLQSVSTTVLASAFSALIFISTSTTSVYEAGAVAALGLAFSLRRLQKRWETARGTWQDTIREGGRDTLRRCEGRLRGLINGSGGSPVVDTELKLLGEAKEAVENARHELDALPKDEN